jgi:hypothetical protein
MSLRVPSVRESNMRHWLSQVTIRRWEITAVRLGRMMACRFWVGTHMDTILGWTFPYPEQAPRLILRGIEHSDT